MKRIQQIKQHYSGFFQIENLPTVKAKDTDSPCLKEGSALGKQITGFVRATSGC